MAKVTSRCSKHIGSPGLRSKDKKGLLPALPHKGRQLLEGRKAIRNTVRISIQGKPNRRNRCSYRILHFPCFQVKKKVRLVGTCKALCVLAKPCVSQVTVSQTTERGVSDTSQQSFPRSFQLLQTQVQRFVFFFFRS